MKLDICRSAKKHIFLDFSLARQHNNFISTIFEYQTILFMVSIIAMAKVSCPLESSSEETTMMPEAILALLSM